MRSKILMSATAAIALMFAGSAFAAPPFSQVKKDDELKNPQAAETALTKTEAKDAKKKAHIAKSKAKTAEHKAEAAAKDAQKAASQ